MNTSRRSQRSKRPLHAMAYAGMLAVLAAMHACSARQPEAAAAAPPAPPPQPVAQAPVAPAPPADTVRQEPVRIIIAEPPATSELALMMRDMAGFTDSTRARLATGRALLPFPEPFRGLRTAKPTPNMVDHRTFDPYAMAWLVHLDRLYAAPAADRPEIFNTLVQTCAACHTTMCPGPLVRINKMKLPGQEP